MTKEEEMTDEELEEIFEQNLKRDQAQKDKCGTAIPHNREVGIQRNQVKMKDKD